MIDLGIGLFGILFNPITVIIVVVVILLANDSKKKKAAQAAAQAGNTNTNNNQAVQHVAPPKPKNPMAKWNWLLYIGSFLIVLAMIYFVDSVDDSAVAPTTIILTLIIYAAGLAIHKTVDYLRPVGKAFTYSALLMIPLWLISLEAINLPGEIIPLIVSITFMVASFLAAFITESKVLGYAAMLSPIPFIMSFHTLFFYQASGTRAIEAGIYFLCLAPMVTAILPMTLWLTKPKWLPIAFRHASMGLGLVLIPFTYVFSLLLFFVPDLSNHVPLIRTLCAVFMLVYAAAHWYRTKKHGFFVTLRFALQGLIIAIVSDALNYSILRLDCCGLNRIDYTEALTCAIVWLLTFLAQVVYSLYANCKGEKEEKLERTIGILSIVGIFLTPALCADFERIPLAIIWLVICFITAVLGVLHSLRYKNVMWSIATVVSILIAPFIFGSIIVVPAWEDTQYLICFSIIGAVFLAGYYVLRQIQKHESDTLGIISLSLVSVLVLINSFSLELSGIGYLIVAVYFAIFAVMSQMKEIYEIAIYAGALSIFSFCGNVYDGMIGKERRSYSYRISPESTILRISLTAVRAHILGAALLITNWLYEHKKQPNQQVRLIFGYTLFSLVMTFGCLSQDAIGWSIFFLIEQVACLLFSITSHRTWMIWFSSIEIFITALTLTGGFNYIWLGIIGIALIAIVVWQLKKNNDKLKAGAQPAPVPTIPDEVKTEDKPAESDSRDEVKEDLAEEKHEDKDESEGAPSDEQDKNHEEHNDEHGEDNDGEHEEKHEE